MNSPHTAFDRLFRLWDEVEAFPVDSQVEANLHLMRTIADWLRADYAYWCGLVRVEKGENAAQDLLGGWRMRVTEPYRLPDMLSKKSEELHENQHLEETIGTASIAIMREAGTFRVRLLRELVDLTEYESSEHFQQYLSPYGLTDRVYIVTPVTATTESCYCFELAGDNKRFSDDDAQLAGATLRGLRWFQRRLILSHGLTVGGDVLTPMERTIVLLLLTDKSERDIATAIDRAHSTTHNYITGIYRKFRVNNRAGLAALWLDRSR